MSTDETLLKECELLIRGVVAKGNSEAAIKSAAKELAEIISKRNKPNRKRLLIYRLYDKHYQNYSNKITLSVTQIGNVLSYVLYMGWQDSGMGYATSNLQMQKSLPTSVNNFKDINELDAEIRYCLSTGVGSNTIQVTEILNDL